MEFNKEELECIKYFPESKSQLKYSLNNYFENKLSRKTGLTKKQIYDNPRYKFFSHDFSKVEELKSYAKEFLETDAERFMKFNVSFIDDVGYDIYVNKDNSADNRLRFTVDVLSVEVMIRFWEM